MKKPIFALPIFALVLVLTGCGKTAEVTKTSKDVDFYTYATDDSSKPTGKMTLHFFNGVEDVPYISMDEIMSFYASASEDDPTFKMTGSYSGKTYTMRGKMAVMPLLTIKMKLCSSTITRLSFQRVTLNPLLTF